MDITSVLQRVFGYSAFRGEQAAIIQHVVSGNDVFVLMPTGGGKSLCYQIPALIRAGVGIVVSPLIALMKDQVDALLQQNVRAAFLNSSLDAEAAKKVEQALLNNDLDLLYVAPERLLMPRFLQILQRCQIALFAIDEAHCVSAWGHDFRPEYIQLSVIHEQFPGVPRIALTATADAPTKKEIIEKLHLQTARHFIASFDRSNIFYRISLKNGAREQLYQFLKREHPNDAGIVYCLSRKRVEDVAQFLEAKGYTALPYHAGLTHKMREKNQMRFIQEESVVMVATVAFGMGIDKPNVRFVVHMDLPKSMEGYYQETGRAGRDGLPANAYLLYGLSDVITLRHMLDASDADEKHKRLEKRKLEALLGFCETTLCRRQVLLSYFGEQYDHACGSCDNCLASPTTIDGLIPAQMALSCIYRTGERFGVKHLIDVLLGKTTDAILRFHHDRVSTFGIGKEYTSFEWQSIYRQLIAANFISVDMQGFGSLKLTEKSMPLLKGVQTVTFRLERTPTETKPKQARVAEKMHLPTDTLWKALKEKRLALAREQAVPPYVIFHDRTLLEMHDKKPLTLQALREISGVGESKLKRYGEIFIQVIQSAESIPAEEAT